MSKLLDGKEVLQVLVNKGLVHLIAPDRYALTSKVMELEANIPSVFDLDLIVPEPVQVETLYPEEIAASTPSTRLTAIYNYCGVPDMINKEGKRYMVRSGDKKTKESVERVIANPDLDPTLVLDCITDYYKTFPFPKSFKNFLSEEFETMYQSYVTGNKLKGEKRDNKFWS
tara:strand:+ start:1291 stop:1803 length:513 start_codon:yes stop_codon:yes gene_type:complete